jgi:hypothetical protein
MTIKTKPLFYYDYKVTANDIYINFDDGLGERTAKLSGGSYSFTGLSEALSYALNEVGGQEYTVTTNRLARSYTISAASNFDIFFDSGSNAGLSVASKIGFDLADKMGNNSYTSDYSAGKSYSPQFPLQKYIPFENNEQYSDANINEAGQNVEVYSVSGIKRLMEFNITYVTDLNVGGAIAYDPAAVSKLREFMRYATSKGDIEFMEDESNVNTYSTIMLERSKGSSKGIGFKLTELYGKGLVDFYETGLLTFREKS